jgi:hypothetical protein
VDTVLHIVIALYLLMSKWYKFTGRLFKIGYAGPDAFRHCPRGSYDVAGDVMLKIKRWYDKKIKSKRRLTRKK